MLRDGYKVGPDGALIPPEAQGGRGKSWRPGGEHVDPREKSQVAKKAKWQKLKQTLRAEARTRRTGDAPPPVDDSGQDAPPSTPPAAPPADARGSRGRWSPEGGDARPPRADRPQGRDRGEGRGRPGGGNRQGGWGRDERAPGAPRDDRGPREDRPPAGGDRAPRGGGFRPRDNRGPGRLPPP